jgi:hypothetical protein
MTVTLSPPVRIFAFVGVLAAVGLAAFLFLAGRGTGDTETSSAPLRTTTTQPTQRTQPTESTPSKPSKPTTTTTPGAHKPRPAAVPASGLPLPVHRALRRNKVVVVVVYTPNGVVDSVVRTEARAGAKAAHAGLVQVSALSERLVQPLVTKTGVLPNPAVVVLKRPGVVVATLGVTDRATVAQAVAQARR